MFVERFKKMVAGLNIPEGAELLHVGMSREGIVTLNWKKGPAFGRVNLSGCGNADTISTECEETAMTAKRPRVFLYLGLDLPDPDPELSVDEVKEFFSPTFPGIEMAEVVGPEITEKGAVYSLNMPIGTFDEAMRLLFGPVPGAIEAIDGNGGIFRYLDCSTGHVTKADMDILDLGSPESVIAYANEYGAFVHVPYDCPEGSPDPFAEMEKEGFSESFVTVLRYARERQCYWVKFDADGIWHEGLDRHEW